MAINVTDYATFNARLAQVVGAGSDSEVAGTIRSNPGPSLCSNLA